MSTSTLLFDPLDTVMFRDGRPFNQDDEGLGEAHSLFPPMPETLYGAVRVLVARGRGWEGGDWSGNKELSELLGDRSRPGALSIAGPFLTRECAPSRHEILLPAPANLRVLDPDDGRQLFRLAPPQSASSDGAEYRTDLGQGRMTHLEVRDPRPGPLKPSYLSADLFAKVLEEGPPIILADEGRPPPSRRDGIVSIQDIASSEPRVGIARRVDGSRRVQDGMLYVSHRRRLSSTYRIAARVSGLGAEDFERLPAIVPLGGETRCASVEATTDPDEELQKLASSIAPTHRYFIVLVTPAIPKDPAAWRPTGRLTEDGLPGSIVWAVTGKPVFYAGFRSEVGVDRGGAAMRMMLPAGSVFFFESQGESPARLKDLGRLEQTTLSTEAGYGRYLIGNW